MKKSQSKETRKQRVQERSFRVYHWVAMGLIAAAALLAYSNTFQVPFQFDDRPNIVHNPNVQIKVLTWDRIEQLIRNTYKESIRFFSYLTLALNYYLGGLDVFGYHLVNLIVHIATGILLYWFLILTLNLPSLRETYGPISFRVALLASLIFIVHPIQTQSVTYIVQRMACMAGMFYLLSMVLYIQGRRSSGISRIVCFCVAGLTYLLGVFTKENVAVLPLFIFLYEFYFFQGLRFHPQGGKTLWTILGLTGLIVVVGLLIWGPRYLEVLVEGYKIRTFTLTQRVLTQFSVVLYYVTLLIYPLPSRLNLDYDFPVSNTPLDPPYTLGSILIVAGLIGYAVFIAKRKPLLSFFILWYFGNLVMESSIFPLEMVFEHRLYLPSIGPFALFSIFIARGIERLKLKPFWKKAAVAKGER